MLNNSWIQSDLIQKDSRADFSSETANEILALMFVHWCHFIYVKQQKQQCDCKECTIYFQYVSLSLSCVSCQYLYTTLYRTIYLFVIRAGGLSCDAV